MDPKIVWQKWMDPFGSDEENLLIDEDGEPKFLDDENSADMYTNKNKNDDPPEPYEKFKDLKSHTVRVMATPMGIIPITENTASSKIFNFWTGHTNFNITRKLAEIIEDTEGVEALDIFTRYRFRIAIGKVFTDSHVMRNINDNVYTYLG